MKVDVQANPVMRVKKTVRIRRNLRPRVYKSIEQPIRNYIHSMDIVDITDRKCRKLLKNKARLAALESNDAVMVD